MPKSQRINNDLITFKPNKFFYASFSGFYGKRLNENSRKGKYFERIAFRNYKSKINSQNLYFQFIVKSWSATVRFDSVLINMAASKIFEFDITITPSSYAFKHNTMVICYAMLL